MMDFLDCLPEYKISMTLTHNEHRVYYETVEQWLKNNNSFSWVSEEEKQKALETDSVWVMHWYPHTPVGLNSYGASDLDVLLKFVKNI